MTKQEGTEWRRKCPKCVRVMGGESADGTADWLRIGRVPTALVAVSAYHDHDHDQAADKTPMVGRRHEWGKKTRTHGKVCMYERVVRRCGQGA